MKRPGAPTLSDKHPRGIPLPPLLAIDKYLACHIGIDGKL